MAVADDLAEAIGFAVMKARTRKSTAVWMSERAGGEPTRHPAHFAVNFCNRRPLISAT